MWSIFAKITASAVKCVTSTAKDVSGTMKDATGIRKDIVETKLAERKLEREESPIQLASFDDVKEFDPKYRRIKTRDHAYDPRRLDRPLYYRNVLPQTLLIAIVLVSTIVGLVFRIKFFKVAAYCVAFLVALWIVLLLVFGAIALYHRRKA